MRERATRPIEGDTALVTGGAGFIGSNLVDRLIGDGACVVCLDNLHTGRLENLAHLEREARFEFVEHDVTASFPQWLRGGRTRFTRIYHLACPASPPHYQADPERTLLTCVLGTRNALRLAEESGARFLLTSTSEVYGDPEVHPQSEHYRGSELHRPACLLRRRQARRRDVGLRLCPRGASRGAGRAHLQHLRSAHALRRRAGRFEHRLAGA